MLKGYNVEHVFGLPGETTLSLYREWLDYPEVKHVLARDERSSVFMADGYAKASYRPGVCEGPSVGSTHMLPGVAEAYKGSVPMLIFTTDIPLHLEKRNMLTGLNQTALFSSVTKESMILTDASEASNVIRRAFRVATTGRPGPVHLRLPMDVLDDDAGSQSLHVQKEYSKYPGSRPVAQKERVIEVARIFGAAERPVIICGQGVLFSQAWGEVQALAELYGVPVGTTMSGKGSMPEDHPLSIGVVGARGGTNMSNSVVSESDIIFYIGSNTDSASTDKWTIPNATTTAQIIHLDISGAEVGNSYPAALTLIGDAKATLRMMIDASTGLGDYRKLPRIAELRKKVSKSNEYLLDQYNSNETPVNPVRFTATLQRALPDDYYLVVDVGVSAIYTSAYFKVSSPGRRTLFNYAMGALGYALPAAIGVRYARPESCTVALVGDGSFGFTAGELETVNRVGGNINVILFDNGCYGWIKAAAWKSLDRYVGFPTEFCRVDYLKVAEGFGLDAYMVDRPAVLEPTLRKAFNDSGPSFIWLKVLPENELIPPVPGWIKKAEKEGKRYIG
jgi:acetolactate synthase-1/2/3 large subunit